MSCISNVWMKWVKICSSINNFFERIFSKWAGIAGNYPKSIILIFTAIALALMAGFARFKVQNNSYRLYFDQNSQAKKYLDRAEISFNVKLLSEQFIITMSNGSSVLNSQVFKAALMLHNGIGKTRLKDICVKFNKSLSTFDSCLVEGILQLFDYNTSKRTDQNIKATLLRAYNDKNILLNGRPAVHNMRYILGKMVVGNNTIKADALRMVYYIPFKLTDEHYKERTSIEDEFVKYLQSKQKELSSKGMQLYFNAVKSIDDSINESTGGDITFVIISITLMCTFTTIVLSSFRDLVGGHLMVGFTGICCIALGVGSAFGLVMATGQYYVAFVGVLPFLVIGVGVDDMFIILGELDRTDASIRGLERLKVALGKVGVSVTMTTLTDMVAFAVSASTVFPAVYYFCIYAALSILFSYILIMTVLVAAISLDIKRIERGALDMLPCKLKQNYEPWQTYKTAISNKIMFAYGRFLMKIPVRISVITFMLGLAGAGIYGTTQIKEQFDKKQLSTGGSYFALHSDAMQENFPFGKGVNIILDDKSFNYSDSYNQKKFAALKNICTESKYLQDAHIFNWMNAFHMWSNNTIYTGNRFYQQLQVFLIKYPTYRMDVKFKNIYKIQASRMVCRDKDVNSWSFRKDSMLQLREDLKRKTTIQNVFPASMVDFMTEQVVLVKPQTINNLVICSLSIVVITTPYLVHPGAILLMFLAFVTLIFELFALMAAWNVALNSISMIIIVMAIGFAVDYSAHVTHAYMVSDAGTPEERMIEALGSIGSSVLVGGLTTFLGVVVTAFSRSELFRIFFKMMFGIVVLGLLNGLVFLPVLLSIFCRTKLHATDNTCGTHQSEEHVDHDGKHDIKQREIVIYNPSVTNEYTNGNIDIAT